MPAAAPRAVSLQAARWYSAGGGLKKEEVEGRIMGILSGFDKVNDPSNVRARFPIVPLAPQTEGEVAVEVMEHERFSPLKTRARGPAWLELVD